MPEDSGSTEQAKGLGNRSKDETFKNEWKTRWQWWNHSPLHLFRVLAIFVFYMLLEIWEAYRRLKTRLKAGNKNEGPD